VIVKGTGDFVPAPEGLHNGVCVDVIDEGLQQTAWGQKWKVALVWELDAHKEDGTRFSVRKRYTASLHEKSNLAKDLKSWRGRAFTAEELSGFDVEKVLGAPCKLLVQHTEKDGATYANVTAIMRADPHGTLKPSGRYVRAKDRPPQVELPAEAEPIRDDAVPF
jgi:hypothetical protein